MAFPEAVVNGENGFLAQPGKINDWVKKINLILENENLQKKLSRGARQKAEKEFSWEKCAKENEKAYLQLISK
jgi:glycosyltransferase involved in cell wall biosynthesis